MSLLAAVGVALLADAVHYNDARGTALHLLEAIELQLVVEQAKGLLMYLLGCDEQQAVARLREMSRDRNITIPEDGPSADRRTAWRASVQEAAGPGGRPSAGVCFSASKELAAQWATSFSCTRAAHQADSAAWPRRGADRRGAHDGILQPFDVMRVDHERAAELAPLVPAKVSPSTSAPLSSLRQATYSLATRFMPSRNEVTSITSAARNSAAISSLG